MGARLARRLLDCERVTVRPSSLLLLAGLVAMNSSVATDASAAADPNGPGRDVPAVGAPTPCVACEVRETDPRELFNTERWKALLRGEIVVIDGSAGDNGTSDGTSQAAALIPYPPAEVWSVLTDFERWPAFMPLIRTTEIERHEGNLMWVRQAYRVMFLDMAHTTIYDLEPDSGQLSWSLDKQAAHDIAASEGQWSLIPISGARTVVRYHAHMNAGRSVPDFVAKMLREHSLQQLIAGLRAEVARRYGVSTAE